MVDISVFAPGRIEILGNHTDYNAGVVLSAAIQLGTTVTGRCRSDEKIVCSSEGMDGVVVANLNNELSPRGTWADYPFGVVKMFLEAGAALGGFEMHFSTTLPIGAGLSSSAAMEVATAVLLTKLFPIQISSFDLARLCRRAENEFVGVNSGLLDQVSSVFGQKNHVVYLDCREAAIQRIPFPSDLGFLVIHSGVRHTLMDGEYNKRREQCFDAARCLGVSALRDATSSQLFSADLSDLLRRRAAHIVGENERVCAAVEFLRAGRGKELGHLMTASHQSSMENFENSTPELDALVVLATSFSGCYGARLTGGGFGGAILALIDIEVIENVKDKINEYYGEKMGNTVIAYSCTVGDGALIAG